jgi:hypothetical protein
MVHIACGPEEVANLNCHNVCGRANKVCLACRALCNVANRDCSGRSHKDGKKSKGIHGDVEKMQSKG